MLATHVLLSAAFVACDGLVTRGRLTWERSVLRCLMHAVAAAQIKCVPHLVSNQRFLFAAWGSIKVICEVVTAANMRMLF
jgi:hypothetical protein